MTASWVRLGIGAWAIISPWILGVSGVSLAKWSSVITGLILVILSLWELFGNEKVAGEATVAQKTNTP